MAKLILDQVFEPTPAMKLYAYKLAKSENSKKQRVLAAEVGIATETISRWKQINGFAEWLNHQVAEINQPIIDQLEKTALENISNFRFWQALAAKHNYLIPEPLDPEECGFEFIDSDGSIS
ncbi:MAG: hypothetical protein AB7N80_01200 [Bdellovibrionales bacterium]